jgi:hypothetical protein
MEAPMNTVNPYIDQNHQLPVAKPPVTMDETEYEIRCGMCAREISVDEKTYRTYRDALVAGLENEFRCEVCSEEY